jgi:hypothetical protein
MRFHAPRAVADGLHTPEWRWRPIWVCENDARHFEVATSAEEIAAMAPEGEGLV